ncbi:hypothetical protein Dimus_014230, partial [Dionaea muscipula]
MIHILSRFRFRFRFSAAIASPHETICIRRSRNLGRFIVTRDPDFVWFALFEGHLRRAAAAASHSHIMRICKLPKKEEADLDRAVDGKERHGKVVQ